MSLAELQQQVTDLVRDRDGVLSSAERDRAIASAVGTYSRDKPRTLVVDVEGVGTQRLPLPAGWVADSSSLVQLEYPIGNIPETLLDISAVVMYQAPSAVMIQVEQTIPAGDDVRVTFSAPHTVDGSTDTTPAADRVAIANLAAAICCEQLAAYYATESAPTIGADTVDHASKSRTFTGLARGYRKQYADALRIDPTRQVGASAVVDLNTMASDGKPRLFHPRGLNR